MEELRQRILSEGQVRPGDVLKVDSFLNHQIDPVLLDHLGAEFARLFSDRPVNKILTIEASGIALAIAAAPHFGNVPVVFAKKGESVNLDGDKYRARVHSYTHGNDYDLLLSKRFLGEDDHVVIIDDFLANGNALEGMIEICSAAGATIEGFGIAIEKGHQVGGKRLREEGWNLQSLAIIESMDPDTGEVTFRD